MRTQIEKLAQAEPDRGAVQRPSRPGRSIADELRWHLDRCFDRTRGTGTSDNIGLAQLDRVGGSREQDVDREPASTRMLGRAMEHVASQVPCTEFDFIAYGPGQGRTLLMIPDCPSRAIVGVEFPSKLHDTTRRSSAVRRYRRPRCTGRLSKHADATSCVATPGVLLSCSFNRFFKAVLTRGQVNLGCVARQDGLRVVLGCLNLVAPDLVEYRGLFARHVNGRLRYVCS